MTTHALPARGLARERVLVQPAIDVLFLTTILFVTFAKIHWELAVDLSVADVLTAGFLVVVLWDRVERGDSRFTRTSAVAFTFFVAFLLLYLAGFFDLDTDQALTQWSKGMVKFVLHFGFLVAGVTLLGRRSHRFYWYALAALCGGIGLNAVYATAQLLVAEVAQVNLNTFFIQPLTGQATELPVWGAVNGQNIYRPNGLSGDTNHLGIELVIPLLVLTPIYLRLEARHRLRTPLAVFLAFCLVVELTTLSRSGLLGLAVGALILAIPYRHFLRTPAFYVPFGAVVVLIATVVAVRFSFFERVFTARTQTSRAAASPHFLVYEFIPDVLSMHPLLGLGLNNFAVYYEFVTGRSDFGPHSFYVATIVETGLVGTTLLVAFLIWIFQRLAVARRLGRALQAARDPLAARVRPLAWGMTAALVATMAANIFYLTMTFYYFYVLATLAVAIPVVFGRRAPPTPAG